MRQYMFSYKQKMLHSSAKQGIITLIPKIGRDLLYIKNWWPIVLLNTDYKILSKVVTNRIKSVLPNLIHMDQTGFLKNRNISEILRKILDIMQYTIINDIPGLLISVDFEKAFDRVEHPALYKIMQAFNFGPAIIKWVTFVIK